VSWDKKYCNMKKFRLSIIIASSIVIIGFLIIFDYNNLLARQNFGFALGIVASIFNIIAMVMSIKKENKEK
jgi:hypothetical protein